MDGLSAGTAAPEAEPTAERQLTFTASPRAAPAEEPLFAAPAGSITVKQAYTGPVGQHQYLTAGGTLVTATLNKDFEPTTTSKQVFPCDEELYQYLARTDAGWAKTYENMDRARVKSQVLAYCAENPAVMRRLGISDVKRLTPRQALLLAEQIAVDIIEYNKVSIAKEDGACTAAAMALQKEMDTWGVHLFFEPGHQGVCRHYAEVIQGIFSVFKDMQTPADRSQLVNSYVKLIDCRDHVWAAMYSVQSDGQVLTTQVDPTYNDPGPGKHGETRGKDFTFGPKGLRDYFRHKCLLTGTGERPLKKLIKHFDRGHGWHTLHEGRWDGMIDMVEVERHGSIDELSKAIDDLPAPLRPEAYYWCDIDVQEALDEWREQHGRPALSESHPEID